ncbi:hypothetical protein CRN67_04180 [Campylobacter blaseri]|uniref:Permease n=1 Tax=Campylobacter blaseri TaxID=2042961 RepID=A0A2P8R1J8_9BACT|nr:hypothetical protein CQ405_04180 [Campylobacter blaseri]PSM54133.1 hypothetical protein CRN67_04180 [Campylobacter blaseri]
MLIFIENQFLKMDWLYNLTTFILKSIGIDLGSNFGGSLHFFIYDVIKITILLCTLIFLISYIQSYFSPQKSKKILVKFKGIKANIMSALLGTVTPFCSCSSIPLFMGFTSSGLPLGVTFSFLISSPMVDLGSLVILTSIFGFKIAVAYVIAGLIIAVIGGFAIEKLKMEKYVESFIKNSNALNLKEESLTWQRRVEFAKNQVISTFKKVFKYILIGVAIGSIIHNYIPTKYIEDFLGNQNLFSVILATLAGVPIYADIFGTIPIAEALLDKGAYLGTVLAFMMAITTLSLPSLIMLKQVIKPKLLILFVGICIIGIVIVGYLFNVYQLVFL